jgi:hypothetical protein
MRTPLILLMLVSTGPLSAQSWRVDPKPITAIGSADLSGSELLKVTSARRLSDGRILVTTGDPREVRVFGKDGKLLSRFGRGGEGPGEFGYEIDLIPTASDSILVWDIAKRRVMVFQADGTLLKESVVPSGTSAQIPIGIYRRTLARIRPRDDNSCVQQAIAALPQAPPTQIRELFADGSWRIWTRDNGGAVWSLHTVTGRPLGAITLPTGFELLEAGRDFVLGRTTDADGFDHLAVYHATLPPAQPLQQKCVTPARDTMPVSKLVGAAMRTDMRNAVAAFEGYHSKNGRYPTSIDEIKGQYTMSTPYEGSFVVTRVGAGSFSFAIFDKKTTMMCVIAVGDGIPAGWPNGNLMCGW